MNLNPSAITKLLSDSPTLHTSKQWFDEQFIIYVARSIYGIAPESVDTITRESIFQAICERFNSITVSDIQLAFKTHVQEEKVYILTRDEFIKPIQKYWSKKLVVISELETELNKDNEEAQKIAEKQRFKEESYALYLDCLNNKKEWSGTPFQAASFADNFKELFTREEKDLLWSECQLQAERMRIEAANVIDATLPISARHLFCDEIIRRALKRGLDGYYLIKD